MLVCPSGLVKVVGLVADELLHLLDRDHLIGISQALKGSFVRLEVGLNN
jgi:hypothetical protein